MRKYHLRWAEEWPNELFDLYDDDWKIKFEHLSGVYILGSSDNTMFTYPWGSSPIFYIGKSLNLMKRLRTHRKQILQAADDHNSKYFRPKNQYGAAFGAETAVYYLQGSECLDLLESKMITDFYDTFGSIPVGNGAWPKAIMTADD
ncbi:hypothetical protein [Agarivorans sp. 1_MG-2023]|uniref:hypothetical protein n=1 Tax=Agarivorans sp. 1_MG-2023 TaxID=3062634 RepID=UPI0026E2548F|nr:hypothetical protein [Agarivorans sp. 1_MG-2023]MDO6766185.1 hypothetical protein [Agarivorans sp. 1_MG-2023]